MRASVTLFFCILFAGVVYLYFYLVPEKSQPVQAPVELVKLLPLEDDDEIIGMKIDQQKEGISIYLQKHEDGWHIEAPIEDVADPLVVHGMAAALKLSAKARRLHPEKDWGEYGLENPELSIGIRTAKNDELRILYLGDESPIGRFVYARWKDDQEYFLLDLNLRKIFERPLLSYRVKKVFLTDVTKADKLRVETRRLNYEMSVLNGEWLWSEPIAVLGEVVKLEEAGAVVSAAAGLYIKEYVAGDIPEEVFEYPFAVIRVFSNEAEKEAVEIGQMTNDFNSYIARRRGDQQIFLVDADKINRFLKQLGRFAGQTE